jgi:hypothetical protein
VTAREPRLSHSSKQILHFKVVVACATLFTAVAQSQTAAPTPPPAPKITAVTAASGLNVADNINDDSSDPDSSSNVSQQPEQQHGIIYRGTKRVLNDEKGIYLSPFKPSNLKWDALVLAGTAGFLIADRHIENNLPGGHYTFYQDTSDIAIGGLSAALASVWIYGIKTQHHHARETGFLELEALTDAFLLYAPMQFIAARQRPGEGNGHGDFLRHSAMNTSFPGGHAMFTWTMATVLSHEYSQKWVQVAAYGSAFTVTLTRFLARDHWASDMWVGSALGIGIGAYVFHTHCDPELSPKCRQHSRAITPIARLLHLQPPSLYRPSEDYELDYNGRPISQ